VKKLRVAGLYRWTDIHIVAPGHGVAAPHVRMRRRLDGNPCRACVAIGATLRNGIVVALQHTGVATPMPEGGRSARLRRQLFCIYVWQYGGRVWPRVRGPGVGVVARAGCLVVAYRAPAHLSRCRAVVCGLRRSVAPACVASPRRSVVSMSTGRQAADRLGPRGGVSAPHGGYKRP
jgi:hypothetical protein